MISKYSIVALSITLAACLSSGKPTSACKAGSEARQQSSTSIIGHSQGGRSYSQNPKKQVKAGNPSANAKPAAETTSGENLENAVNSVVISGGFNTDPQDHGRPVVLIAAALGVPTEVFREAFHGVTPAGAGSGGPSAEQAQQNKTALLKVLAPYGITNERLDEVSNYYRYNNSKGEIWTRTQATATATVVNGVVTGVTITNPGAGYSSNPTITITGPNGKVTATAALSYTKDFKTNGSISAITIIKTSQ